MESEVSLICVGTPSQKNGNIDLTYINRVCEQIGSVLKDKNDYHIICIRSTVLPGTVEKAADIIKKCSGKEYLADFDVCSNPEFLREGTSVSDFYNPPYSIIGLNNQNSLAHVKMKELYDKIDAPLIFTDIKVAEMIKYANNAFHALKVCFANEIGNIGKKIGVDSHEIMRIFAMDTKLNLSSYYLKPGFAFGGSCLPKDVRAINHFAVRNDIITPVLSNLINSNELQVKTAFDLVQYSGSKKIGILGFSFKAGTDDLRESPVIELIEKLLGKGYHLKIYDKNVNLAKLMGANKAFIEKQIPHINKLICDSDKEVIEGSEVIIIGNNSNEFVEIIKNLDKSKMIIDLVRIIENKNDFPENYTGICW